jgi:hypothetical protein
VFALLTERAIDNRRLFNFNSELSEPHESPERGLKAKICRVVGPLWRRRLRALRALRRRSQ